MASTGQLAAGIAHEINNPIGFINANLDTLSQYANNLISICDGVENHVADFNDELKEQIKNLFEAQHYDLIKDDIEELLEESKAGLNRVKDIVDNLKQFSLDSTQGSQVVDLNDVATQTIKLVSTQYASHHYKVESPDEKIEITANPGMIKQALMNILLNAAQAIPDKGYVKLTLLKITRTSQLRYSTAVKVLSKKI